MRLLFIGALPEPTTGQSLACKVFLDALRLHYEVDVVDLSKDGFLQGFDSLRRAMQVFRIIARVARLQRRADVIYLTISESIAGNLKDLLLYLVCCPRLSRVLIHLHGGAGIRRILLGRRHPLRRPNEFFLRRLGGAIVLGARHAPLFQCMPPERVHIVPNFAQDELFTTEHAIALKFATTRPLRVLFLSNLLPGKGHEELLAAFRRTSATHGGALELDFAGGFESPAAELAFVSKLDGLAHARYHGVVKGAEKRALFHAAHIFCLPTYNPYEGQPISILEAYAAGCAVITTDHSGIGDIFSDGVNGLQVEIRSPESLSASLEAAIANPRGLAHMAATNLATASQRYRTSLFNARLLAIVASLLPIEGMPQAGDRVPPSPSPHDA